MQKNKVVSCRPRRLGVDGFRESAIAAMKVTGFAECILVARIESGIRGLTLHVPRAEYLTSFGKLGPCSAASSLKCTIMSLCIPGSLILP